MNDTLERLKNDFSDFSCNVSDNCLFAQTSWKASTPGVSRVRMSLKGLDPFTGKMIGPEKVTASFDRLTTKYRSGRLSLYGTYEIILEAFDTNDNNLGVFHTEKIEIKTKGSKPYLKYAVRPAAAGWSCIEIEREDTNCWERLRGHLWISYNGQQYRMPDERDDTGRVRVYIPSEKATVFTNDKSLPEPQKKKN